MISVSALSSYMYCPRKLYLSYVLKLSKPPKDVLLKGTIRHEAHEKINDVEESLVKKITKNLSLKDIQDMYKKEYSEILREAIRKYKKELLHLELDLGKTFKEMWPFIHNESMIRSLNIFTFSQKHNIYGKELWEKLTPKIVSEFPLESQSLGIRGRIDQIEQYENEYVPYELKTGKTPDKGVWPGHKIQIGAYLLMLQEKSKVPIKEGFVRYLDTNETRQITLNPFLRDEIIELIKKVNVLLKSKTLPDFVDNENKCNACELKKECYNESKLKAMLINRKL
jgi:CRISPR-associated exonuclease Cas4